MTKGNFRRPESVLVVVFTEALDVLLIQRADLPDFWQSVTGSLEDDELPVQTARRELSEETGLDGVDLVDCDSRNRYQISPHWASRYAPGVTHNTEHVFTLRLPHVLPITLNPSEHLTHEWCRPDEAVQRCSSATNRQAIIQFVNRQAGNCKG